MATNIVWNGVSYSVPASGETAWSSLSAFIIALGNNAQSTGKQLSGIRTALATPVTVVAATDFCVVTNLTSPGAVAVNLPTGVNGQIFAIVDGKGDAGTNNITITPASGNINGASTYVISRDKGAVIIQYSTTETQWKVLAEYSDSQTHISASSGVHGISGSVVGTSDSQTLTNKAIDSDNNTITNIVNADIKAAAAIEYSKLNLSTSIVNADVSASAAIARTKVANGTADHVVINDGSGTLSSEAQLAITRGGTGQATANASLNALLPSQGGNSGKALVTDASNATWQNVLTDPTTTRGDLIRRGASAVERFAAVTDNRVVAGDGTDVVSKQIDDPNFFTTGAVATTSLPGIVNPYTEGSGVVYSGTWTPTLTNSANITSSTADYCMYMRVGKMVSGHMRIQIDPTSDNTTTTLGVSLPIASSFTSGADAIGLGQDDSYDGSVTNNSNRLTADTANDRFTYEFTARDTNNTTHYISFTYEIK